MEIDFRLSCAYSTHHGVAKLERKLGAAAVLAHIRLLMFAGQFRPDGHLSGMDVEDIALAADYEGDTRDFVSTLARVGLLVMQEGRYMLSEWGTLARVVPPPSDQALFDALRAAARVFAPEIFTRDGNRCVYCGRADDLTLDHVVPLSRGGSNEPDNLATACRSCNSSKNAKTPEEWGKV